MCGPRRSSAPVYRPRNGVRAVTSSIVVSSGSGMPVALKLLGQLLLARGQLLAERIHVEPGLARLREQALHPLLFFLDVMLDLFRQHLDLGIEKFVALARCRPRSRRSSAWPRHARHSFPSAGPRRPCLRRPDRKSLPRSSRGPTAPGRSCWASFCLRPSPLAFSNSANSSSTLRWSSLSSAMASCGVASGMVRILLTVAGRNQPAAVMFLPAGRNAHSRIR